MVTFTHQPPPASCGTICCFSVGVFHVNKAVSRPSRCRLPALLHHHHHHHQAERHRPAVLLRQLHNNVQTTFRDFALHVMSRASGSRIKRLRVRKTRLSSPVCEIFMWTLFCHNHREQMCESSAEQHDPVPDDSPPSCCPGHRTGGSPGPSLVAAFAV